MPSGRQGIGLTVEVALAIPPGSLQYWQRRFDEIEVAYSKLERRFGELTMPFQDTHGLHLALVETDNPREFIPWVNSPIPPEVQNTWHACSQAMGTRACPHRILADRHYGFYSFRQR